MAVGCIPAAGVAGGPALAQNPPAVGCEVADFSIVMKLYQPLSGDGSGAPAGPLSGTLEIFHQKVPKERRRWSLDGKRPAQFWNYGSELKIQLVLGSGEERIELVIDTLRRPEAGEHTGTFRLTTPEVKLTGRLACAVG